MKFIKENGIYLALALFALILLYFVIVVEFSIRSTQPQTASGNRSLWYVMRQQLANALLPAQVPTAAAETTGATVILPQPTATLAQVVVQITLPPTTTPLPPTPTPLPPPSTPTPLLLVTETTTAVVPVALRIGYVQRERDCISMTEIVTQLIQTHFQVTVATQQYDSATQLFDALAAREVDFTLCYSDPDDRAQMRDRLGLIRQIGVQHFVGADYKLQIWANGTSKATLRNDYRCILDFLEKVDFTTQNPQGQAASSWLQQQQPLVDSWLTCPF